MVKHRSLEAPVVPSRRRFLQGMAAATAAGAVLPGWLAKAAQAATSPLGPGEGSVVVVMLSGGNDAVNTVVPLGGSTRSRYEALRGTLAVPAAGALPLTSEVGLHPSLPALARRYASGKVAVVQGIGLPEPTLSHFQSLPDVMAGFAGSDRSTGWLGRYLDGVSNWDSGVAGLMVSTSPRLHLVGARAKVPALPGILSLWAPATAAWDKAAQDAVRSLASVPTGLGAAADRATEVGLQALDAARQVVPMYPSRQSTVPIVRDLQLAASALNSDVGTRAICVEMIGWDTHALQGKAHPALLSQLDAGIEAFWTTLAPSLAKRTCVVVISEFGRRPSANASGGTDHGTAGTAFVIGDNVRGGIATPAPALDASSLDEDGNPVTTVDFRSLYASVLDRWLGADDAELLGATYPQLDLFTAGPGA